MLVAKGTHVTFTMEDGRKIRPSGALFHDESGRDFPARRCLITTFQKGKTPLRKNKWFGPDYQPLQGNISIPGSKGELVKTSNWDEVGEVSKVEYERVGEHGGGYHHGFKDKKLPLLYRRGKVYSLLMRGALKLNWRGFVDAGE